MKQGRTAAYKNLTIHKGEALIKVYPCHGLVSMCWCILPQLGGFNAHPSFKRIDLFMILLGLGIHELATTLPLLATNQLTLRFVLFVISLTLCIGMLVSVIYLHMISWCILSFLTAAFLYCLILLSSPATFLSSALLSFFVLLVKGFQGYLGITLPQSNSNVIVLKSDLCHYHDRFYCF